MIRRCASTSHCRPLYMSRHRDRSTPSSHPTSRRMIFGMRAGHHHAIVAQKLIAVAVEILIGDEIVIDALMIEPVIECVSALYW